MSVEREEGKGTKDGQDETERSLISRTRCVAGMGDTRVEAYVGVAASDETFRWSLVLATSCGVAVPSVYRFIALPFPLALTGYLLNRGVVTGDGV